MSTHPFRVAPLGIADATDAVVEEAVQGGGGLNLNPIDFLTGVTESSITGLHGFLQGMGVSNAYGLSIIFFTVLVKIITFPLTYQQLSSTTKMQRLSPKASALAPRPLSVGRIGVADELDAVGHFPRGRGGFPPPWSHCAGGGRV